MYRESPLNANLTDNQFLVWNNDNVMEKFCLKRKLYNIYYLIWRKCKHKTCKFNRFITVYINKCFSQLSFIGHEVQQIPSILCEMYGSKAKKLDLSCNHIASLDGLQHFTELEELILDNNYLDDGSSFCVCPAVHTLSLNKNKVRIRVFIKH